MSTWTPPHSSLKVRQVANGKWIVVHEQRHQSGRILSGPFDTREQAIAARKAIRKGER
jgi:hypothetical protein